MKLELRLEQSIGCAPRLQGSTLFIKPTRINNNNVLLKHWLISLLVIVVIAYGSRELNATPNGGGHATSCLLKIVGLALDSND